jgi:membrane protease YdiL (CAAX protease family)
MPSADRRPGADLGKLTAWLTLIAVASALAYGDRAASGKPPKNAVYHYDTGAGSLILYAIILGVVLAIARGGNMRELFALRRPQSWWRAIGWAVLVLVVVYGLNAVLDPFLHPGREQGYTPNGWQPSHAGAFALNFFTIAVVAPIVEELTFRGLGFSLLLPFGTPVAVLGIGLAFGLWHGLIQALPVLVAFGSGLAWIRARSDSVYPGMALHAVFNAIALVVAIST